MNFTKSDILKMCVAAIAGAIVTLGIQVVGNFNLFSVNHSQRITWHDAMNLRNEYASFWNPLNVRYEEAGSYRTKRLDGFVLDASDLDSIINKNPIDTPDAVLLYFGKEGSFGFPSKANMHIIAVGSRHDTLLINPVNVDDKMLTAIYDKADPCPPNCPNLPK